MWPWTAKKRLADRLERLEAQLETQAQKIASLEESDAQRAAVFLAANDVLKRTLARWTKREARDAEKGQGTTGAETLPAGTEAQGQSPFEKAQRRILARRTARASQGIGSDGGADDGESQPAG